MSIPIFNMIASSGERNGQMKIKKKPRTDDYFLIDNTIINTDLPNDLYNEVKQEEPSLNKIGEANETEQSTKVENDFLSSLDKLTIKQIPISDKKPVKIKKPLLPNLIRSAVLLVCAGVFVYSATQIVFSYADSIKKDQLHNQLQNQFYKTSELPVANQSLKSTQTLTLTEMLGSDSDGLHFIPPETRTESQQLIKNLRDTISSGKFPDAYAWVQVPLTRVDNLIVLGKDNDFYLDHAEDRSYNEAGAVFADYRTNKDNFLSNRNFVIYAHNRSNGAMFGTIPYFFKSDDRWNLFSSCEIKIITQDAVYIYKPFSAYITSGARYTNYRFNSNEDWTTFMQEALDNSIYAKWTTGYKRYIKPNANLLTFSTCTNNYFDENQRYVLHAVLVEVIKNSDV